MTARVDFAGWFALSLCALVCAVAVACSGADWRNAALDAAVCTAQAAADSARERGRHGIAVRLDSIAAEERAADAFDAAVDAGAGGDASAVFPGQ